MASCSSSSTTLAAGCPRGGLNETCATVDNLTSGAVVLRTSAANAAGTEERCVTIQKGDTDSFTVPLHLLWDVVSASTGKVLRREVLINQPYTFRLADDQEADGDVIDYECKDWLLPGLVWGAAFGAAAWLDRGVPRFVADPALCEREFGASDPAFCADLKRVTRVPSVTKSPLLMVGVIGMGVMVALWAVTTGPLASTSCAACHGRRWAWTGGAACRWFGWCDCVSTVLKDRCAFWAQKTGQPYEWSSGNADAGSQNFNCNCCLKDDPTSCVSCIHLSGAPCQPCAAK